MVMSKLVVESNKGRTVLEPFAELDSSNLLSSSPLRIRSLAISTLSDSQTLIYIGTQAGFILLFSLNTDDDDHSLPAFSFTRSLPIVKDRSLESIHVFPCNQRILVHSEDGFLFLLDFHLLHPVQKLSFPKGVTFVAPRVYTERPDSPLFGTESEITVHPRNRLFRKLTGKVGIKHSDSDFSDANTSQTSTNCLVAVAVGKRLFLIQLVLPPSTDSSDAKGVFVVLKEIQCVHPVKTMVWVDDSIIVATAFDGYTLYSCVTGQNTPLFSLPDPSSIPYLKYLCKGHEILLLVDNVGVIVSAHGEPLGGSMIFRGTPDAIGELSFYLIAPVDGRIDLYHKKTGHVAQSISFAGKGVGSCILVNEKNKNGEFVVVASPSTSKVICFRKVSAEEQIKDLLRKKKFKEAVALVEELEVEGELTKEMLSFVHAQVGFLLLFDLHFEESVDHFLKSETMQPSEIFPFIMPDPNRWSMQVPRNRYWGLHPPPVPLENVVDDGLLAIQRAIYLRKAGVETAEDEYFLSNPPSRADLLESAIDNIIRYLRLSRAKDLTLPVREGVDTLLMYLYRALNRVEEMEVLASSENNCVVCRRS